MSTLIYKCPHCDTTHEVDESLVGDRIDCRNCGRPFEASMPIARPVEGTEGEATPASHRVGAGEGEIEDEIISIHPAVARQSPLTFFFVLLAMIAGVAGIVVGLFFDALVGGAGMVFWIAGLILLVGGLLYWFVWWLQSRFTTLTVTEHRTILHKGLISRRTSEVRHKDVRNLKVDQDISDRLLGVGTLSVSSAGQDEMEIIVRGVPDPEKIAAIIRDMQQ